MIIYPKRLNIKAIKKCYAWFRELNLKIMKAILANLKTTNLMDLVLFYFLMEENTKVI